MSLLLSAVPGGDKFLERESCPTMLHFTPVSGRGPSIKTVDPGMTAYMVRRFIRRAANQDAFLSCLVGKATGQNFRPTHAYLLRLSGQSVRSIQGKLNHRNYSTTKSYISGVETRNSRNRKHKDYMRYLIGNAKAQGMKRTGSGYVCASESQPQKECTRWDKCQGCDGKRIVFGNPVVVAEWLAWEEHLVSNKSSIELSGHDRWDKLWGPRLAEFQVFIAMSKKHVIRKAKLLVPHISLPPIS